MGATTAQAITFESNQPGEGHQVRTFLAGTKVYVECERGNRLRIRVPGTMFEQDVYGTSLIADA